MALATAGVVALATACTTPPPTGPVPVISSATATPTVVAGEVVTATVTAGPPVGIYFVELEVFGPAGARLPSPQAQGDPTSCSSSSPATQYVHAAVGEPFTASCTMPAWASNGTWMLEVTAASSGFRGTSTVVPFEVIGGVDDISPPSVTTLTGPPASVARGDSFDLAFRLEDASEGPELRTGFTHFTLTPGGGANFLCSEHEPDLIDATTVEASLTCAVPANAPAGTYVAQFAAEDRLTLRVGFDVSVVVVA